MVQVDELRKENQYINDLSNVLSVLVDNADLRDNSVFCELLDSFTQEVQAHLLHEDQSVYAHLLKRNDRQLNDVASQFLSNTRELKKILSGYTKRWCGKNVGARHRDSFATETKEVFRLVEERISLEDNKLFPALPQS
jgi:hemerythrin-like domain-containing protein